MMRSVRAVFVWRFIGNREMSAGRRVSVKIIAAITPTATMFPNCLNGGEIEKFSARKPIAVVIQATAISPMCSSSARRAHSLRSGVSIMVCRIDANTWMTLATAKVMMMSGAMIVTEFIATPDHPSAPSPTMAEKAITMIVISVPKKLKKARKTIKRIAPNIIGVREAASSCPDTEN